MISADELALNTWCPSPCNEQVPRHPESDGNALQADSRIVRAYSESRLNPSWSITGDRLSSPSIDTITTAGPGEDFAGAYLDTPPDYPDDVMEAWTAEKQEQCGADWPWVQEIMRDLASVGVYLPAVKPGNITLRRRSVAGGAAIVAVTLYDGGRTESMTRMTMDRND